jgi:hypothetical protein
VYTIFDLTRIELRRPKLLAIDSENICAIKDGWKEECDLRPGLRDLIHLARECKYEELSAAFLKQDCARVTAKMDMH